MTNINKRERLIDSASTMFHARGMAATSLADIAKHADIPIGNVYYYFKTKEDLALAALNLRREQFAYKYVQLQETIADPRQRLIEALGYYDSLREEYTKHGCPISKMIETTAGEPDAVSKLAAQCLADFVGWAEHQFGELGHGATAKTYATSLMAGIQGATVMAKAFQQPQVFSDEIARLVSWVEAMPNRRITLGKVGVKPNAESDAA